MASQAERDAQALKETFDGLTESIRKSAEQSGKIRQTFLDLSSTANASGQAWTVISRLTSGTGFWKIQNRIRAISNFFQFQEKRLNEQVQREQEQIKLIKDQISEREKLAKAQEVVNKIASNNASIQERQAFFQSDQLKYYESLFGRQNAIVKVTEKLTMAQENLNKVQGFRGENRARQMQKDLESELSFRERFFSTSTGGKTLLGRLAGTSRFQRMLPSGMIGGRMADFFRNIPDIQGTGAGQFRSLRTEEQINFANLTDMVEREFSMRGDKQMIEDKLASLNADIIRMKADYDDAVYERENDMDRTLDDFQIEELKDEIKELRLQQKELSEQKEDLDKTTVKLLDDIRLGNDKLVNAGITVKKQDGKVELVKIDNPQTGVEYLWNLYTNSVVYKTYSGIMKSVKGIPFGSIFKSLGIFLKSFLFPSHDR